MEAVFLRVFNMSLTASYVIAAVLLLRLLLRRAPKKYSYLLWSVVGFRLLCPFSFSSVASLFNVLALPKRSVSGPTINYIPPDIAMAPVPTIATGLPSADAAINAVLPPASPATSANPMQIWLFIGAAVWLLCVGALLLYSAVSLWRLHRQVRTAVRTGPGVWECGGIRSPFILGLFRPQIYLPFGLGDGERAYILAHERCHLRRWDHLVKVLSFLLLAVHWFNPLVWVAFILMTRDMEMSCDEAVLAQNGPGLKKAYSTSLLSFAVNRPMAFPTPLAFGETGVKARIRNVLRYKPARKWEAALALVLCLALAAACAANPVAEQDVGEGDVQTPWPGDLLANGSGYTYPGNHWEFQGVTCSLLLSQPVRQGEGGVWCVERWSGVDGNLYSAQPDTDLTAKEYYEQLQAAVDAGEVPLQTPYEVAADYISNVLGQSTEHLAGYELAEGARGDAMRYLTQLFLSGDPSFWYRDGSGDSRSFLLSDTRPERGSSGENLYLTIFKSLFKDSEWERLDEPVAPEGSALCLGQDAEHCFVFYLGTEYVTLVSGDTRISYRTPWGTEDVFGSNLPDYVLRIYSQYENEIGISVPAAEGETFEEVSDRWLAAYREHLLDAIPESTYALTDMAVVEREVSLTREGDDGIFGFTATLAVKPVEPYASPWWAGNTGDGEGEWEGWMVMYHEYRMERIDGTWYCTGSGTGGLSLD